MAAINAEAAGERTLGSGGALGEAFQQVMQGFSLIQEAVQQQERRMEESLREMKRMTREAAAEHERRLQEEAARRAVTTALEEKLRRVEERVETLERLSPPSGGPQREQPSDVQESLAHLESPMEQLEASTKRSLQSLVPRVDALLKQLEKPSHSVASPTPFSISSSTSTSDIASVPPPLSSASAFSSAPRPHSPSACSAATPRLTPERRKELGEQLAKSAMEGREAEVQRLLDDGADVNNYDSFRCTALMLACRCAHANIASLLIGRGADMNARDSRGWTVLHEASYSDRSGRCTLLLIGAGAPVDSASNAGKTPLHVAAAMHNEAAARALLAAGASKSVRDNEGKTPTVYADIYFFQRLRPSVQSFETKLAN